MTLKEFISALDSTMQFDLAITLIGAAMPAWENYTKTKELKYKDSVVGLHHRVEKDIISRTLKTVRMELSEPGIHKIEIEKLMKEFSDPIVAMQDGDWELPYEPERIFYSAYNLLKEIEGEEVSVLDEPRIYVAINQAMDAALSAKLMTDDSVQQLLQKFKTSINP
jgi:hypothetical protein